MEWWEYLVVIGVSGFILLIIASRSGYGYGEKLQKLQFGTILISLCFLLLMLITYKLFLT
jgi:hypothetical protein